MLGTHLRWVPVVAGVCLVPLLASCALLLPSRPLTSDLHLKNSSEGVDFLVCVPGELSVIIIGRGTQGSGSAELLPANTEVNSVARGDVVALRDLTTLPESSRYLVPLEYGEQLEVALLLSEGESSFRLEAVFAITYDAVAGFRNGEWLSADGRLSAEPCEE